MYCTCKTQQNVEQMPCCFHYTNHSYYLLYLRDLSSQSDNSFQTAHLHLACISTDKLWLYIRAKVWGSELRSNKSTKGDVICTLSAVMPGRLISSNRALHLLTPLWWNDGNMPSYSVEAPTALLSCESYGVWCFSWGVLKSRNVSFWRNTIGTDWKAGQCTDKKPNF